MVKIAICDDETEFLDLLSDSLDSWCRAHQPTLQLYRFTNGDELISAHRAYGMDLIQSLQWRNHSWKKLVV